MKYTLTLLALFSCAFGALAADSRPNFMIILLDDSGWTDFSVYGSRIQTPNIDRLAGQGMKFNDCHSAAPNCSPSRSGMLTGRAPTRIGIYSYLPDDHPMHLRDSEITIAELLRDGGYRTGHFGKWHVTNLLSDQPQPIDHGFEYSLGTDNNAEPSHLNPVNFVRNGKELGEVKGYSCQIVSDEAIGWLESLQTSGNEKPFFSAVWFHEPHTRIASPPELIEAYQKRYPDIDKKTATYFANIANVDLAVGKLLDALERLGHTDNTVIYLTSDNGPLNEHSKGDLKGFKSNVWEGGHRVPGIVRWPGRVQPGSVSETPISGVDVLPTFCDIAGIDLPSDRAIDGTSIKPLLLGKPFKRKTPLFWFFYRVTPSAALRDGDWVIIANTTDKDRKKTHWLAREDMPLIKSAQLTDFELYNLRRDRGQTTNVASRNPEKLAELKRKLVSIHREILDESPVWDVPADYGKK